MGKVPVAWPIGRSLKENVRFEPATLVTYRACGQLTAPWTVGFFVRSQVLPVSSIQAPIACAPPMPPKVVRHE
jgi:hypothetical protein